MKGIAQMTKEWKIYVNVTFNEDVNVKHDTVLSRFHPFSALMTKSKSFYPLDGQKKKHKSQTHSAILIDICTIIYSVSRKKKCEWARGRRRGGETKDQNTKNTYKNIKLFNLFR